VEAKLEFQQTALVAVTATLRKIAKHSEDLFKHMEL
jgi:hypothetical protein